MKNEDLVISYQSTTDEEEKKNILGVLYQQNIGYITKTVIRYAWNGDIEDLKQEAFFGLAEAVNRWDADKGSSFLGYAGEWIKQAIRKYLNSGGRCVKLPQYIAEQVSQYEVFCRKYVAETGAEPTDEEIKIELELTSKQLETLQSALFILDQRSTEEPTPGTDGLVLGDSIADPENMEEAIVEEIQQEELKKTIWKEVDALPAEQADTIKARFLEGKTISECCRDVNPHARQDEQKALRKLRQSERLKPFYEDIRSAGMKGTGARRFRETGISATERAAFRDMGIDY